VVSVICPVYNEEKYIKNCVDSILLQDYPKENLEVLFCDGMSSDKTREIIIEYSNKFSFIKILDNPERMASIGLNKGIEMSKGEIIIRLDGHCVYPPSYISILVQYLDQLGADNVGAVLNTVPARDTAVCRAIAIGMSHKFGVGNSYFRIGCKKIIRVDTVPFGCFRRKTFEKIGLFDTDLIRNQDDEFNGRIIKNGGKIFLIPEIIIDYYARDTLVKMSKMFYQYGLFKPLVNKKLRKSATIRQFFPLIFLLGLFIGGITSFLNKFFFWVYILILVIYGCLALFFSIKETIKYKKIELLLLLPFVFLIIHVSYGWGYLKGVFKIICRQKIYVN
jgi:glycosyltransferase involved in cell wall biosynthesis